MKISMIYARGLGGEIGYQNKLLWSISDDMKRFKEITTGKTVVMGRLTWESIPEKYRPLPNRYNIVLTNQKDYNAKGAFVANNIEDAIKVASKLDTDELVVIGGAAVYRQFFDYIDTIYETVVYSTFEQADAILDTTELKHKFKVTSTSAVMLTADGSYNFSFIDYERIKDTETIPENVTPKDNTKYAITPTITFTDTNGFDIDAMNRSIISCIDGVYRFKCYATADNTIEPMNTLFRLDRLRIAVDFSTDQKDLYNVKKSIFVDTKQIGIDMDLVSNEMFIRTKFQ